MKYTSTREIYRRMAPQQKAVVDQLANVPNLTPVERSRAFNQAVLRVVGVFDY